jgi:hypothetical protein
MKKLRLEVNSPRVKKLRIILLILLPILLTGSILFFERSSNITMIIFLVFWFLFFIDLGMIALFTRKYYNWCLFFLMLVIIAIIFRSQRWPLTRPFYIIGFSGLSCMSFYSAILFLIKFDHQRFLKYIGFTFSIILSEVALGLLWKIRHWPGADILLTVGLVAFIPFLFAFLFTLPGSNYINWNRSDRTVFFRAVIVPMIIVYTLCVLMFVLPDLWQSLTSLPLTPFRMEPVELLDKAGLH